MDANLRGFYGAREVKTEYMQPLGNQTFKTIHMLPETDLITLQGEPGKVIILIQQNESKGNFTLLDLVQDQSKRRLKILFFFFLRFYFLMKIICTHIVDN